MSGTSADSDDDVRPSPVAYLVDHAASPDEALARSDNSDHQLAVLGRGMQQLDARSRDIIKRRWLDDEKVTLQELADEYGVSAERIRQIEANAMKKIRALFEA